MCPRAVIGEIDEETDSALDLGNIRAEPLNSVAHWRPSYTEEDRKLDFREKLCLKTLPRKFADVETRRDQLLFLILMEIDFNILFYLYWNKKQTLKEVFEKFFLIFNERAYYKFTDEFWKFTKWQSA